jgi:hypothetical protein
METSSMATKLFRFSADEIRPVAVGFGIWLGFCAGHSAA